MKIHQRIDQHPSLAPILRDGLKILELPIGQLVDYAEQQLSENPLLELDDQSFFSRTGHVRLSSPAKYALPYLDERWSNSPKISAEMTLREHLLSQVDGSRQSAQQMALLEQLADRVDTETGLLSEADIPPQLTTSIPRPMLEYALQLLRDLNPPGICAENTVEAILKQLERKGLAAPPVPSIVRKDLEAIAQGKLGLLARKYGLTRGKVERIVADIRACSPYPTTAFSCKKAIYPQPDVLFYPQDGMMIMEVPGSWLDELQLSRHLELYLSEASCQEDRAYVLENAENARSLIRNITHRRQTLERVAEYILNRQQAWLSGAGERVPMSLKQAAEYLGLNASTVSRAIKDKYAATPFGMIQLRRFFSFSVGKKGVSQDLLETKLRQLLAMEDPLHPFSDAILQQLLEKQGIVLSRRGISYYRKQMEIPNSAVRRQLVKMKKVAAKPPF